MYRIFVVEDDAVIAGAVQRHLESWGYQVACAVHFDNVLAEFAAFDPQLVLLDISLPFFNGHHWCREIRKVSKVPILFLTSASDDMNLVMAMEMGGDDLLAKPFHLQVLSAKVQAMLRRAYDFAGTAHLLSCGGAVLNVSDGTLTAHGQKVSLTRNEFKILQLLLEHRGEIVSREAIMTQLWESDSFVDENTLTVNVARLRKKLESAGLTDYYSLWAHQIKTPIAAMDLLLQEDGSPHRGELEMELLKIGQYVEMVLSYLRLDSDSTDYVLREYPLDDILRQAVRKFAKMFILKKITLDFQETGKTVLTDEKWLLFVVEQVLSNALKYTPAGGTIRIYGDGVTVVIADNGIGIREEDQARVFEKGFTGYNGRADKKSTGIGLYLCRQVMDRLNHSISLTSRPGQGTLVRLDLSRESRMVE